MEEEYIQNTMVAVWPIYIPVSPHMLPPLLPVPRREGQGESAPESVPEKDSSNESATSEKDACARAALGQVYEQPKKWHFYADGLWLRATVLHLLNDR